MANKIVTILDLDDRGFKGAIGRIKADVAAADTSFSKLKAGAKGIASEFRKSNEAQAAAATVIGAAAYQAIQLGSDLEESINAVRVSYGDAAESVLALGENSAKSFGLSKSELNQLAVQFSSFAKTVAESEGRSVADVLGEMTQRVADFASVMNLDLNEATAVFMSTMAGETEPIRRFGKDVSAAAVELYAMENGLIASKDELTESIKVQARYGLLMEQTADTAGDFANTSDSLANQQRILAAEVKDTAAEIGTSLMPMLQGLMTALQSLNTVVDKTQLDKILDVSWAQDAGTQIGRFFSALARGSEVYDNFHKENVFSAAEQAAQDFDITTLKLMRTFDQAHAFAERYGRDILGLEDPLTFANIVATRFNDTLSDQGDQLPDISARLQGLAADHVNLAEDTEESAEAAEAAAEAIEKKSEALAEQRERMEDLLEEQIKLIGSDTELRIQQRQAAEAAQELNDALSVGNLTMAEAAALIDEAAIEQRDYATAVAESRIAQMEANGETVDAQEKASIYRQELQRLADQLEGPLRDAILGFIADLDRIPSTKIVTIRGDILPTTGGRGSRSGTSVSGSSFSGESGPRSQFTADSGPRMTTNQYVTQNYNLYTTTVFGGGSRAVADGQRQAWLFARGQS